MYDKKITYKFQLKTGIIYTGKVIDEDNINIFIRTTRDEEYILNKNELIQAKVLGGIE